MVAMVLKHLYPPLTANPGIDTPLEVSSSPQSGCPTILKLTVGLADYS